MRSPHPVATGPDKSLYHGCKSAGPYYRADHPHPSLDVVPRSSRAANFGIASPTALKKYNADAGTVGADGQFRPSGTFATQHPIGTGAYKLESWRIGDKLVLVRNDKYWGTKAKTKTVIFRPISDTTARLQALQSGELDFANNLAPQDVSVV